MSRFYPIIDLAVFASRGADVAGALAEAGCDLLQVRAKTATSSELYTFAQAVCDRAGRDCRVIVNDRLDVALAVRAAGVHLGEDDLPVEVARRIAPGGFIIGATARDPRSARRAAEDGADYIGCGAVFPTGNKSDTRLIGLKGLAEVAAAVDLPVYAIAGITLENCVETVRAGAYGAAGISAIAGEPDPAACFTRLERALQQAVPD